MKVDLVIDRLVYLVADVLLFLGDPHVFVVFGDFTNYSSRIQNNPTLLLQDLFRCQLTNGRETVN